MDWTLLFCAKLSKKYNIIAATPSIMSPTLTIDNQVFDVMEKNQNNTIHV